MTHPRHPRHGSAPAVAGSVRGVPALSRLVRIAVLTACVVATSGFAAECDGEHRPEAALAASAGVVVLPPMPADSIPTPSPGPAHLPTAWVDTRLVEPTGRTIRVRSGDNLQRALDGARPGDVVSLDAGATFTGSFQLGLNAGDGWITVRTSAPIDSLVPTGTRATPAAAGAMARIVANGVNRPAIRTAPGAHGWRLVGLEITIDASVPKTNALVILGQSEAPDTSQLGSRFILDRLWIHGTETSQMQRCVILNSGAAAVIDSWLSDCHIQGYDSQAIVGWNGPGPFKIVDNYLEGAGENVMFGGAEVVTPGAAPSDIEIRRNHFFKPLSWRHQFSIKNLLELKNARRVLIEGNVFDGSWVDGQTGNAILLKSSGEAGVLTEDVTVRWNIIRNVGAGFSLLGVQGATTTFARRFTIRDNLMTDVATPDYPGEGRLVKLLDGVEDVTFENNTMISTGAVLAAVVFDGRPVQRFVFRNNVLNRGTYGIRGSGKGEGTGALAFFAPGAVVTGNLLVGDRPGAAYPPGNDFASAGEAGFVNLAAGDVRLARGSRYWVGAGGRLRGANVDSVRVMTRGVVIR